MTARAAHVDAFIADAGWHDARRLPLDGDASFRRYVRLVRPDGARAMLMDAPPPEEDVQPFIHVDTHLRDLGFSAPEILFADAKSGLLLLEDFGDATFTRILAAGGEEEALYSLAVDVLIALHQHEAAAAVELPGYDDARLLDEAALLVDWFLPAVLGAPLSAADRDAYLDLWRTVFPITRRLPRSLVLRDYHVDNLMGLDDRAGIAACGLLDFQDAVIGPPTYDLVSLLEDARRDIDPAVADRMTARYLAAFPALDRGDVAAGLAVLGAQRHAKVIGIFTRLDRRDGKPVYLRHIPRVWRLFERSLQHPDLAEIRRWVDATVPPDLRDAPPPAGPA